MAMLEVFKPSCQRLIHIADDRLQTMTIAPLGMLPELISKLGFTLPARPAIASFKVIAQKIKTLLGMNHARLGRMQCQAGTKER